MESCLYQCWDRANEYYDIVLYFPYTSIHYWPALPYKLNRLMMHMTIQHTQLVADFQSNGCFPVIPYCLNVDEVYIVLRTHTNLVL